MVGKSKLATMPRSQDLDLQSGTHLGSMTLPTSGRSLLQKRHVYQTPNELLSFTRSECSTMSDQVHRKHRSGCAHTTLCTIQRDS